MFKKLSLNNQFQVTKEMKSYLHFQEFRGGLLILCGLEVFESIHASKGWTQSESHVSPILVIKMRNNCRLGRPVLANLHSAN